MRRDPAPALLATLCLLGAPGCSRAGEQAAALRIEPVFTPDPPVVGPLAVELTLTDPGGTPVNAATVRVEGDMTHPGMVPSTAVITPVALGCFRAELELTMPGDWVLLVDVELTDGTRVEQLLPLPGVQAP